MITVSNIVLDTKLTPELIREGIARDVIREIQVARQNGKQHVRNHVAVVLLTDDADTVAAIREHAALIQAETLCDVLVAGVGDE